jgi:glycosyltransferase involved in cell wall biosynthesis
MKVVFIERHRADTPSIETVFRRLAQGLAALDIESVFERLPFSNGPSGILRNLSKYRPSPADIYHITGHVHYIALVLPRNNTVLTVHDLRILQIRKGLRRVFLKKLLFDWPVRRLQWVTTISEKTKTDLVEMTGVDPNKIKVIANPLPDDYVSDSRPFNDSSPVLLQVGTAPHKNLERVAHAVAGLDCQLRIVGKLSIEQRELLEQLEVRYSNVTGLDSHGMHREYQTADIVIFCSLYEGFGLPIIEAQAVGRPVITSGIRPMNDVAGDGALLVDPENVQQIRESVERLVRDAGFRGSLIEKGYLNAERFRLGRITAQYAELYREVCDAA